MGAYFERIRDTWLFTDLSEKLDEIRRLNKMSILTVAARARMQPDTAKKLIYTGKGSIVSLLRFVDACNYKIILVKEDKEKYKAMHEIEGAEEQLYKLKKIQANAKQKARRAAQSKREELEKLEREQDFLSSD